MAAIKLQILLVKKSNNNMQIQDHVQQKQGPQTGQKWPTQIPDPLGNLTNLNKNLSYNYITIKSKTK